MAYLNLGDGALADATAATRTGDGGWGTNAAFVDYDNDGDVDIFVSDSNTPHCSLLRNEGGNANHWLTLATQGTRSNRDGLGARIELTAGELSQVREVRSTYGYLGANDLRAHFGLGQHTQAERLRIRWPSGTVQILEAVPADQFLTVTEPLE